LNDVAITPWEREGAISDAIEKASHILEKIDAKWPADSRAPESLKAPDKMLGGLA
jgi:hypothetical protein